MHYRSIHAFLFSLVLIGGLFSALYTASTTRVTVQEEETPYNEYELQFLQSQGAIADTMEVIPQYFVKEE